MTTTTATISPSEVNDHLRCGTCVLIDVREADERRCDAIPGSVHLSLASIKAGERPAGDRSVIVHCKSGRRSAEAATLIPGAVSMAGGIEAWRQCGLPTVRSHACSMSVMQQTQITIGAVVAGGVALGAFVSPWLLLLPAFMGAGLIVAGVTGTCGLAVALSKLPWNAAGQTTGCAAPR